MTSIRFDGQVAVITGGGRGLGRAYANELARRGAKVIVNDAGVAQDGTAPDPTIAPAAVQEIVEAGGQAIADTGDVTKVNDAKSLISKALDHFGRIDILISNAAMHGYMDFSTCDVKDFARSLDIDAVGAFNVTRAAWPHMIAQKYGRLVFVTSSSMFGSVPTLIAYSVGKGAVFSLGQSMALAAKQQEGADIKVNTIAPFGYTRMIFDNPFHSQVQKDAREKLIQPEKTAQFVVALVHKSTSVNGNLFAVGGGKATRLFVMESQGFFDLDLTAESAAEKLEQLAEQKGVKIITSSRGHLNGFYDDIPGWKEFIGQP